MKSALCISGMTRNLEKSFPTLKEKILDRFDPDIFISTWDTHKDTYLAEKYYSRFRHKIRFFETHSWGDDSDEIFDSSKGTLYTTNPMFYKIYRADVLRLEYQWMKKMKYDLVIRTRTDLEYKKEIDIKQVEELGDNKNKVFVGNDLPGKDWIRDCFAFGSSESMIKYSSTWLNLPEIKKCGITISENILLANLRIHKLEIGISDFDYNLIR